MSRTRRCEPVPVEVRETADLLERRWQLSILYAALTGALRFNEFADAVAGIFTAHALRASCATSRPPASCSAPSSLEAHRPSSTG